MSFRTRQSTRRVKKGVNSDDIRRKRGDQQFELRKAARDEQLQKRRMKADVTKSQMSEKTMADTAGKPHLRDLQSLRADVLSNDPKRILTGTRQLRKLLSVADRPPIKEVLELGVVKRLVLFLKSGDDALTFEAAWALTNIASGTRAQTKAVLDAGAVPLFVRLLGSKSKDVQEQSVWALGNIAGDCSTFRDYVLHTGGLKRLMQLCAPPHHTMSLVRNAVWALSNLCRGKPQPPFQAIRPAISCFSWLLKNSTDEEVLTDAAWAISYLTDDSTPGNVKIQAVLKSGTAPRLIKLLGHHLTKIQTPILRAVGNIVTGDDRQTQEMLNKGVLQMLIPMLVSRKRSIRKEVCWALSNITAGTSTQIEKCIKESVLPPLITVLRSDEFNVQKEACWALSNITNNGKPEHIQYLVKQGMLPAICGMLACSDSKIILVALEGIENTLKVGQEIADSTGGDNRYCDIIEECHGVEELEKLQHHDVDEVYEKSASILSTYFQGEEISEQSMAMVPKSSTSEFSFGSSGSGDFDFF